VRRAGRSGIDRSPEGWKRTFVASRGLDWMEGGRRYGSMKGRGVLLQKESMRICGGIRKQSLAMGRSWDRRGLKPQSRHFVDGMVYRLEL
jgi:hypothetical protein